MDRPRRNGFGPRAPMDGWAAGRRVDLWNIDNCNAIQSPSGLQYVALIPDQPRSRWQADALLTRRIRIPQHCTCHVAFPCPCCLAFHAASTERESRAGWRA